MLHEITEAIPHADHTVTVIWADGVRGVVSFTPIINKGGLFSALKDPDYFVGEMRILRGGIGLTWPEELDFSADGLRRDSFPQHKSAVTDKAVRVVLTTKASPRHSLP